MRYIYFLVSFLLFNACGDPLPVEEPEWMDPEIENMMESGAEVWQLVRMTGGLTGWETSGMDMMWQEAIVLQKSGLFVKFRKSQKQTQQVSGNYEWDDHGLVLYYAEDSDMVGNCVNEPMERYQWYNHQLAGSWAACDGPGLYYKKLAR